MTNKSPRSQNGKRPRLRLLDINFSNKFNEALSNGRRPHGGLRGSKKHPLSPYSFNKDEKHHQEVKATIERELDHEFIEKYGSPAWVVDANREISHSGENPLFINRLLSPCKLENDSNFGSRTVTPSHSGRLPGTPKRASSMYYRQNTPHQYLSATELPQMSQTDPSPILGRPTRTTLLRARQRCNSAPINAYQKRRDVPEKSQSSQPVVSREPTSLHLSIEDKETNHAFLTGARYNRARLMDAKILDVYGVYMPRGNPLDCFMTGPAASRIKERNEESPGAPPDTPRSDVEETKEIEKKTTPRPSTAPSKRLLSSSTPSAGRPRSARHESASTSIKYLKDESENKENVLVEKLIFLQNDLFITGKGVIVTLRGFKSPPPLKREILPSVTGVSVPQMRYKKSHDALEESSIINQPPPTPVGQLSIKDETEHQPIIENPKSPIPEETPEDIDTHRDNQEEIDKDTQLNNPEIVDTVKQSSDKVCESAVENDQIDNTIIGESKRETNETLEKQTIDPEKQKNLSLNEKTKTDVKIENTVENHDNETKTAKKKRKEEESSVQSTTFITDQEEEKPRHVITIPNSKLEPDE